MGQSFFPSLLGPRLLVGPEVVLRLTARPGVGSRLRSTGTTASGWSSLKAEMRVRRNKIVRDSQTGRSGHGIGCEGLGCIGWAGRASCRGPS